MRVKYLVFLLMFSCGASDHIQGVYNGKFYENGDSAQGSVKIIPISPEVVGIAFNSPYGSFSGSGIDVNGSNGNFTLHMNTVTPYTNTIIYVDGTVNDNTLIFNYNSSNLTHGSFKGSR